MSVVISGIVSGSIAQSEGISSGDTLIRIDDHDISDVLDYQFYITSSSLRVELLNAAGKPYHRQIRKDEYDDLGLEFESYLMDAQQSCRNRCVFCFIDQMPPGLRPSLYFKDDDSRLSFLFGNYITLTNLEERDIDRIIKMHISPVNVSVHTTDPVLRVEMMKNPHAGEVLRYLPRLAEAGIKINTQIVLCPGVNDGIHLERSIADLCVLAPNLQSVSVVPVGLTRYREGLTPLSSVTGEEAGNTIDLIESAGELMLRLHGDRICYPSDEFFLLAGRSLPPYDYYGEFNQLENGVGMLTLLDHEFRLALETKPSERVSREVTIATGTAAFPFIQVLANLAQERFAGLKVQVVPVINNFFGHAITVAGLLCGRDLAEQVKDLVCGEELLIPVSMLRHGRDLFLDDMSVEELEKSLSCRVTPVEVDGFAFLDAIVGNAS